MTRKKIIIEFDGKENGFNPNEEEMYECESCGELYDKEDEPSEVKQTGNHICEKCWDEEEGE